MWQRYNQTSKIFEKSVDNGVTWAPLPLNASILTEGTIPNVAYVNVSNTFALNQNFSGHIYSKGYIYPGRADIVDSQTNWWLASHASYGLYSNTGLYLTGGLLTVGSVTVESNIQTKGQIFPGRIDTVALQNSWYLGSHGAYGLYSNTGLALNGAIWERGRSTAVGQHTRWYPSMTTDTGAGISLYDQICHYFQIGKMVFWQIYVNMNITTATTYVRASLPAGLPAGYSTGSRTYCQIHNNAAYTQGMSQTEAASIVFWPITGNWNVGNCLIMHCQGWYNLD